MMVSFYFGNRLPFFFITIRIRIYSSLLISSWLVALIDDNNNNIIIIILLLFVCVLCVVILLLSLFSLLIFCSTYLSDISHLISQQPHTQQLLLSNGVIANTSLKANSLRFEFEIRVWTLERASPPIFFRNHNVNFLFYFVIL